MRLMKYAISATGVQIVAAHLLLNLFSVNYVWFAFGMGIAAHCVVEFVSMSPLERSEGFKVFVLTYLVGETYLFSLALSSVLYEKGFDSAYIVSNFLFENGASVMLCLTVLSLISDMFTPILRNTGVFGDMVRGWINRIYSGAMRVPLHRIGG